MVGKSDKIPFEALGCQALIAKEMDFVSFSRLDGGCGNVVYNENNIFDLL